MVAGKFLNAFSLSFSTSRLFLSKEDESSSWYVATASSVASIKLLFHAKLKYQEIEKPNKEFSTSGDSRRTDPSDRDHGERRFWIAEGGREVQHKDVPALCGEIQEGAARAFFYSCPESYYKWRARDQKSRSELFEAGNYNEQGEKIEKHVTALDWLRFVDDIVEGKVAEYDKIYDLNWSYLANILLMKKRKFKEQERKAKEKNGTK